MLEQRKEKGSVRYDFDGHSDLLYDVTRRRLRGERQVLERWHLDRLRRGGVEGMVLSLWTTAAPGETFWEETPWVIRRMRRADGADAGLCPGGPGGVYEDPAGA